MTGATFRPTRAIVDLGAIRHNVRELAPPGALVMAVVKANGYGHGAVRVARAALEAGAAWLGVALVEEGIELRNAGIDAPVLLLSEPPPGSEAACLQADITPTVFTPAAAEAIASAARGGARPGVHVKVDTGMHRAGFHPPVEAAQFVKMVDHLGCDVNGLWTHLARAEEDQATTTRQLDAFRAVVAELESAGVRPPLVHAANSGGTILRGDAHMDMVRVGIAMYGLDPGQGIGARAGLRPAMALRSEVASIRRLPAGEAVSYGHRYRLERESTVATVPLGYADGYRRGLSSKADVLIGGRRRRVAGTVTMDYLMADCAGDAVGPGDEVILIGRQADEEIPAEELAEIAGTIPYEIVCGIGPRVPRAYVDPR